MIGDYHLLTPGFNVQHARSCAALKLSNPVVGSFLPSMYSLYNQGSPIANTCPLPHLATAIIALLFFVTIAVAGFAIFSVASSLTKVFLVVENMGCPSGISISPCSN